MKSWLNGSIPTGVCNYSVASSWKKISASRIRPSWAGLEPTWPSMRTGSKFSKHYLAIGKETWTIPMCYWCLPAAGGDATCYESYVRFPTDVKLLWESCHWVFEKQLFRWCKILGVKRPRSKYVDQKRKQRHYDSRRRKSFKEAQKRKKALLYLLEKGLGQLQELFDHHPQMPLSDQDRQSLRIIKTVLV